MQHVKGFYIDAKDSIPEDVVPSRHGYILPMHGMVLDMVDRRVTPSVLVGRVPAGIELTNGVTAITEKQHQIMLGDYALHREILAKTARKKLIDERLLEIDACTVRPMRAKLAGEGTEEDDSKLVELENEARTLRIELQGLTDESI